MKIAIPVDNKDMESDVCISFGRAPYFLIYDTQSNESLFVVNTAADSAGGAGIKAAQIIVDNGVEAILTPRCGEKAANVIEAASIKLYRSIDSSVRDNVKAFIDGKLSPLGETHAGFHNHGGK